MPRSVLSAPSRKLRRLAIAWFAAMSSSGPQGARGREAAAGVGAAGWTCGAGGGCGDGWACAAGGGGGAADELVGATGAADGLSAAFFVFFFNQPKTMGCCS